MNRFNDVLFTNIRPTQFQDGSQNRPTYNPNMHTRTGVNDNRIDAQFIPSQNAELTHNNMMPFFSGKQINQPDLNRGNRSLELFTSRGADEFFAVRNKEVKRFSDTYRQPIYGMPQQNRDKELQYVTPSTRRANEVPWERQYVAPGLNEGFTVHGNDVRHQTWRVKPPTVDQLRVKSNPKQTYEGRAISGKAINETRTAIRSVAKNQPFRDYVNHEDRWLVTGGDDKKEMARGKYVMKETQKGHGEEFTNGPLGTQGYGKRSMFPEDKPLRTTKRQIHNDNPINSGYWNLDSGFLVTKYTDYKTKRQIHSMKDYKGNAGTQGYGKLPSREASSNMRQNQNKEPTLVRRFPTELGGPNLPAGKDYQNYNSRKLNLSIRNAVPINEMIGDKSFAQDPRPQSKTYTKHRQYYNEPPKRYDTELVQMLDNNPFAQIIYKDKEW